MKYKAPIFNVDKIDASFNVEVEQQASSNLPHKRPISTTGCIFPIQMQCTTHNTTQGSETCGLNEEALEGIVSGLQ